jgi:FkbH-like protein
MDLSSNRFSPRKWGATLNPLRWLANAYLAECNQVGPGVVVRGRPIVHNEGRIEIGRDVALNSSGAPVRLIVRSGGEITVGDRTVIEVGAHIFSERSVRIEAGAMVGPHVVISDRDEDGRVGEVVVEAGVVLGPGARIVGPCRIARDVRIPAGTTVRGDVAARAPRFKANGHGSNGHAVHGANGNVTGHGANGANENGNVANGHASHARSAEDRSHRDTLRPGTTAATPTAASPPQPVASADRVPARPVRAALLADSTIDELAEHLALRTDDGLRVESEVAPFDQVVQTLVELSSRESKVDVAVVWTRPEQACPSFRALLEGERVDSEVILAEVDAFATLLRSQANAARFVLVPSWVLPPWRRGLGMLELRPGRAGLVLLKMNTRLVEALAELSNVFVLDAQRWVGTARDGACDPKLWHAGKVAFSSDVLSEAARDIHAAMRGVLGMSRKLVVVDLDDTMWGGIVGDVGWENLQLGGHDANGEAFVEFQRRLVSLTKRGIALAVVSKNEEATALDAMRSHPEMIIRPEMLAAYRINWRDKAQNIVEIAQELNLGLQSVVFLDDNPIERGRVREAIPEAHVPEWPSDPTHYSLALESLRCFDTPHVSAEDLERNAMYATERERTALRSQVSSIDEWLATLDLVVRFERLGPSNVARAAQLLNKTNQLNLRTRRLGEAELLAWGQEPGREVWTVHVADRFGQAGLTGLLGLERRGSDVELADYVLSCRVMGRRVEETMVWAAETRAASLGGQQLLIEPIVTKKNKPCIDFFARLEGQAADRYIRRAAASAPPALVRVEGLV